MYPSCPEPPHLSIFEEGIMAAISSPYPMEGFFAAARGSTVLRRRARRRRRRRRVLSDVGSPPAQENYPSPPLVSISLQQRRLVKYLTLLDSHKFLETLEAVLYFLWVKFNHYLSKQYRPFALMSLCTPRRSFGATAGRSPSDQLSRKICPRRRLQR